MDFLAKNLVFTLEEFKGFLADRGTKGPRAAESLLSYYLKSGRVTRIKRCLYAAVPRDSDAKTFVPDPFALAAKMSPDAILVYHTALECHGRAYSVFSHFMYQTDKTFHIVSYRGWKFRPIKAPIALRHKNRTDFGILTVDRGGIDARITSLERTLVDVLDRPVYSGSWEEIWRSLESIEFFDLDRVVEYTKLLDAATTAARVGFFLEQHHDALMVEEKYLKAIEALCPRSVSYLDPRQKKGKLMKRWNLVVPEKVLNKSWEEIV